eukprot:767281-Hanusia_phi.AAC.2
MQAGGIAGHAQVFVTQGHLSSPIPSHSQTEHAERCRQSRHQHHCRHLDLFNFRICNHEHVKRHATRGGDVITMQSPVCSAPLHNRVNRKHHATSHRQG